MSQTKPSDDFKAREDELARDLCAIPQDVANRVVGRWLKSQHGQGGVLGAMACIAGILEEVNKSE